MYPKRKTCLNRQNLSRCWEQNRKAKNIDLNKKAFAHNFQQIEPFDFTCVKKNNCYYKTEGCQDSGEFEISND